MSVLFVLVPVALVLVAFFLGAWIWSARSGQYDDLETPAMRALQDDPTVKR
jgi:cbb3-type cytochrome oxidase maturation protein